MTIKYSKSKNCYNSTLNIIKNNILLIEQEPSCSAIQKLNLIYWKIGEILSPQKKWLLTVINDFSQDLNNEFPNLPKLSNTLLNESIKFYTTYHNYPITSQQLKKEHIYTLPAKEYLSLLLEYLFKESEPLTIVELVKKLPVFSLPWEQNLILLQKKSPIENKLWYAKKAVFYKVASTTLKAWINHKLIDHNIWDENNDIVCPNPRWFSTYCIDCSKTEYGLGLPTRSLIFWIFLSVLLILLFASSLLQVFLKKNY